jgi:hypothetical protein
MREGKGKEGKRKGKEGKEKPITRLSATLHKFRYRLFIAYSDLFIQLEPDPSW